MTLKSHQVTCGGCSAVLEERTDITPDQRQQCPTCGSKKRSFHIEINDTITVREMIGLKAKRPGAKKPFMEQKSGDDLFRKTGKWMRLLRIFDRDNDSYKEEITDPETGEVIHQKDEPLSQHQGYGSAKKNK